jgi:methionyl aminopeptidase
MVILKSPQEIAKLRKANQMVADVLHRMEQAIEPGVTTLYLNDLAEQMTASMNAIPAFKGYRGFPYALCASVNDQVVHGFPSRKPLKSGDIVSLDFGVLYDGYYGDSAITLAVGEISPAAKRLSRVTQEALYLGIQHALPDGRLTDISHAIQSHVEAHGYSVVRKFVGHGIGSSLHEEPQIPNFGKAGTGLRLKAGMTLAIEPMVNEKGHDVEILDDGWTAVTKDGGLSAHFEHTIAVTAKGPEILSMRDGGR